STRPQRQSRPRRRRRRAVARSPAAAAALHGLTFLRVLPERSIDRPHRLSGPVHDSAEETGVLPPQWERVRRRLPNADRPQRSDVQDWIGLLVTEVKNDGCRRPAHALEQQEHPNLELFVSCAEGRPGDFANKMFTIRFAPRLRARRLPTAQLEKLIALQVT